MKLESDGARRIQNMLAAAVVYSMLITRIARCMLIFQPQLTRNLVSDTSGSQGRSMHREVYPHPRYTMSLVPQWWAMLIVPRLETLQQYGARG